MNLPVASKLLTILLVLHQAVTAAEAITSCKVSVDKSSGVIEVTATGVNGPLRWGAAAGAEANALYDSSSCINGDKAKKCPIADPATIASKTPPEACTLYLADDGPPCSTWIRGCIPGPRQASSTDGAGALVAVDANGRVIGDILSYAADAVYRQIGQNVVSMPIEPDGFPWYSGVLYYASSDCSGTALIADQGFIRTGRVLDGILYYSPEAGEETPLHSYRFSGEWIHSQADCDGSCGSESCTFVATSPRGCCTALDAVYQASAAVMLDVDSIATPPFRVEIR